MICEVFPREEEVEAVVKVLRRGNSLPWTISFVSSVSNVSRSTE